MNILFVTRDLSYPGGAEVFIKNFLSWIGQYQYNIKCFLVETEGHGNFANAQVYNVLKSANITILPPIGAGDFFWDTQRVKNLQNIILEKSINIVHSFLFNADFSCFLAKYGSQLANQAISSIPNWINFATEFQINCTFSKILPLKFRWISSKMCDFSIALEKDTAQWRRRKKMIDEDLEPIISRYTDQIIGVSSGIVDKWNSWVSTKILKIPCASLGKKDLQLFKKMSCSRDLYREKLGISITETAFFTLSRLEPGKGLENLIVSFKKHAQTHPNSVLIIAGDGSLRNQLEVSTQGFAQNIKFCGFLSRQLVNELIIASDFFCLFSESEGLPLSLQEAMGGGKPVIATATGGNLDLVEDNLNGFIVEVDDVDQMLHKLNSAAKLSKSRYIKMSSNAIQKIKQSFIKEDVYRQIINIYQN